MINFREHWCWSSGVFHVGPFLENLNFRKLYRRKRDTCQCFFNFGGFLANLRLGMAENRGAIRRVAINLSQA
jgi:hypothetical protein